VLNTWKGEQWTSCQSISTILLSLSTVLCKNPLLNEPHVTSSHRDFLNYTLTIEYENINILCKILSNKFSEGFFKLFEPQMISHFQKNIDKLVDFCENKSQEITIVRVGIYYMDTKINYRALIEELNKLKIEFKTKV
jgi:hypothetical protein